MDGMTGADALQSFFLIIGYAVAAVLAIVVGIAVVRSWRRG